MSIENTQLFNYNLSNEQQNIINCNNNLVIDAVAGSGKTTTILHIATTHPTKLILQITYNNMLKQEVRSKAQQFNLKNMLIHTYHSVAVNYYCKEAFTDEGIKKILLNDTKTHLLYVAKIDILIIDEIQDMSIDYFNLVKKLIKDTKSNPIIYLFGDKHQMIYEYKGANTKFITMTDKIWNMPFTVMPLSESFRVTKQNAWFINNMVLGNNRIKSNKDGCKIDYYITDPHKIYKQIGKTILKMIKKDGIKPEDIFVLSPSIKSLNSPFIKLENYLVKHKIKCITPSIENSYLDSNLIAGKVVFTTYHQVKGREGKVIILYNFDNSLFEYYLKNEEQDICPNIIYVGLTRSSYKLILIQDSKNKPFSFINFNYPNINKYVNFIQTNDIAIKTKTQTDLANNDNIQSYSVTELVKFISPTVMDFIVSIRDNLFTCIRSEFMQVKIPSQIKIKDLYEDISDLNGIVIPALYEKKYFNEYSFLDISILENINSPKYKFIKKYANKIDIPCVSIHDNLLASNIYSSIQNNLHAKLIQITKYDWLTKTIVNKCYKNMDVIKTTKTKFEIPISYIYEYSNANSNSNSNDNNEQNCNDNQNNDSEQNNNNNQYDNDQDDNDQDDNNQDINDQDINDQDNNKQQNNCKKILINGRIDVINDTDIYELKCVEFLSIEHKLQLIIYEYLCRKNGFENIHSKNFKLLNIKTGEILILNKNNDIIDKLVDLIIENKINSNKALNEEEFLNLLN